MRVLLRIITIFFFSIFLGGCQDAFQDSEQVKACELAALSKLKHPDSYDADKVTEKTDGQGKRVIQINFKAWNDYKVPIPHGLTCVVNSSAGPDGVIQFSAIYWNNRPIRIHELDDINESLRTGVWQ